MIFKMKICLNYKKSMKKGCYSVLLFFVMLLSVHLFLDEIQIYSFLKPNTELSIDLKNSHCKSELNDLDSEVCRNSLKKSNFIWLFLDGFAEFQSGDLAAFKNSSAFYKINFSGYPQSAAVHAEQIVGRFSRNYPGGRLNYETVLDQLDSRNTFLISNHFPLIGMLGEERFKKVHRYEARERYPFSALERAFRNIGKIFLRPHDPEDIEISDIGKARNFIIDNSVGMLSEKSLENLNLNLKNYFVSQKSNLVYYSHTMDSYNHNYGAFSSKTLITAGALLAGIKAIITLLDTTDFGDDYVLFVSSDHGGQ